MAVVDQPIDQRGRRGYAQVNLRGQQLLDRIRRRQRAASMSCRIDRGHKTNTAAEIWRPLRAWLRDLAKN